MKNILFFIVLVSSAMADSVVFTDKPTANAFQAQIDADKGYPKAGKDVGAGIHVSADLSVTTHEVSVIQHPTLQQWSVQTDTVKASIITSTGKTPAKLPADWTPVDTKNVVK